MRNGFGLDLEATNAKILGAIKIDNEGEYYMDFVRFDGLVLLLPFLVILLGNVYEIDNAE